MIAFCIFVTLALCIMAGLVVAMLARTFRLEDEISDLRNEMLARLNSHAYRIGNLESIQAYNTESHQWN